MIVLTASFSTEYRISEGIFQEKFDTWNFYIDFEVINFDISVTIANLM